MMPDPAAPPDSLPPGVTRVTAPNPGPMTHGGTQSYVLGAGGTVAVIDPGPDNAAHRAALDAAVAGARVSHVIVTHAHLDHSAGARRFAAAHGAELLAFGPARAGRSPDMDALAATLEIGGGEGVDEGFAPDRRLADGARVAGPGWTLEAVHTPGHLSSHLCLTWPEGGAVFTGDHAMGWSTTLISPPDGSLTDYLASLDRLEARAERLYLPGHGPAVADGHALVRAHRAHRMAREDQILAALGRGPLAVAAIVAEIYADIPRAMHPVAARNVLAHLLHLAAGDRVAPPPRDLLAGAWRRT